MSHAEAWAGRPLARTVLRLILGAAILWSAAVVVFVTATLPEIAPWTLTPVLIATVTGVIWWKRPMLRSSRLLRFARLVSLVAVGLLIVWALGLTTLVIALGSSGIGPEN